MSILKETLKTPSQREPIPGREKEMSENNAGGFVFTVDVWTRLDRFLMLGTEGGTYYVNARALTLDNSRAVRQAIDEDGPRAVKRIVEISDKGLAPKNEQAIFALAMCASFGDSVTRHQALDALPVVCRIGTHLFQFIDFLKSMRGLGRSVKRAIRNWYQNKPIGKLAYQTTKYRQRDGWSHRDILRLTHPIPGDDQPRQSLYNWITHPDAYKIGDATPTELEGFLRLQEAKDSRTAAGLIGEYSNLSHEMVPSEIKDARVWEALLEKGLPMTALLRNLPTLTRLGVVSPLTKESDKVYQQLTDKDLLQAARIHPLAILIASMTYRSGRSVKGKSEWDPNPELVAALETAFYLSFKGLPILNKRVYIGLDVSGSMTWDNLMGVHGLTPAVAGAALSMALTRQSRQSVTYGFADEMRNLSINQNSSLEEVVRNTHNLSLTRSTDCALPMLHALDGGMPVDLFVVFTDNETWFGSEHPSAALIKYRRRTGIDAKLAVSAMTATEFSIADPNDAGMLDLVGFDASLPQVIEGFAG